MGCSSSAPVKPQPAVNSQPGTVPRTQLVGNYKGTVHDEFLKFSAEDFYGRDELVEQVFEKILAKHITTTSNAQPLLLFGDSGSGKSYLLGAIARRCMAMAALNQLPKTTPGHPWRVFYNFTGFAPGSTDLLKLLQRLLFELQIVRTEWDLPTKLEDAICLVCGALSKPSLESYIIIIDAINQLDEINNRDAPISWLPLNPAPNVRIIVSSRPDTEQYNQMRQQFKSWVFSELAQPLAPQAKRQLVEFQLNVAGKTLEEREIQQLIAEPGSDNPLWLLVAAIEICCSPDEDGDQLSQLITNFPKTLEAMLEVPLKRVERGPISRICVSLLCLIECSVNGLDLEEIVELLCAPSQLPVDLANLLSKKGGLNEPELTMEATMTQKMSIDDTIYQEIKRSLFFYLHFILINAKDRQDFYHASFVRAVRHRYMLSTKKGDTTFKNKIISSWFHNRLANYFYDRCPDIKRRCECFPIHAHRSFDVDRLTAFLANWDNFDAMYEEQFSRALNKAWTYVYDLKMKSEKRNAKKQAKEPPTAATNANIFKPMQDTYLAALEKIYPAKADESMGKASKVEVDRFLERLERVAQILSQNGCFEAAESIADRLVAFTDCSISGTDDKAFQLRHASYLYLKAQILDRYLGSVDYMLPSHLPKCEMAVNCFKAAVDIFRQYAPIDPRIGKALNRLAFAYSGINTRGGMKALSADDAKQAAIKSVEDAMGFYLAQKDQQANLADCYITRGVCEGAANDAQIDYYTRAFDVVVEEFGYFHPLIVNRLYLNIGIYWEEVGNREKAYDFFRKWYELAMLLFGPTHPTSMRTIRVLIEDTYAKIAAQRGDPVPNASEEIQQDVDSDSDED